MEIKYCKCGLPEYHKDDGEIIYTCSNCKPELLPELKSKHKNLAGYRNALGKYCSDETLEHLKRTKVRIDFSIPPWAEDEFHNNYQECTGHDIDDNHDGIYLVNAKTRNDKRWYSAKITFEFNENLIFNPEYDNRIKIISNNTAEINCIHFAGFLLANGFEAGVNILN